MKLKDFFLSNSVSVETKHAVISSIVSKQKTSLSGLLIDLVLDTSLDGELRESAIYGLEGLESEEAIPMLLAIVKDGQLSLRNPAVTALAVIAKGNSVVVDELTQLYPLRKESESFRQAMVALNAPVAEMMAKQWEAATRRSDRATMLGDLVRLGYEPVYDKFVTFVTTDHLGEFIADAINCLSSLSHLREIAKSETKVAAFALRRLFALGELSFSEAVKRSGEHVAVLAVPDNLTNDELYDLLGTPLEKAALAQLLKQDHSAHSINAMLESTYARALLPNLALSHHPLALSALRNALTDETLGGCALVALGQMKQGDIVKSCAYSFARPYLLPALGYAGEKEMLAQMLPDDLHLSSQWVLRERLRETGVSDVVFTHLCKSIDPMDALRLVSDPLDIVNVL